MMKGFDFLVVGAGIFGITTAIELRKRGHEVAVLNPDQIPHPLAASTDISKIVRMEYGTDREYMDMAAACMPVWRDWNDFFGETLFHEVGFVLLSAASLDDPSGGFEAASYRSLLEKGFRPERMDPMQIAGRFPAFDTSAYADGFYHAVGGFAESGRVVEALTGYARQLGVSVFERQTAEKLVVVNSRLRAVETREGERFETGHAVVCAGNHTPYLVPDLMPVMKVTGHPVFHLKPSRPELFAHPGFAVFAADISNTGWYGFSLHPKAGVVKIANHGEGLELHPDRDERVVYPSDEAHLRRFLRASIPALADDPIVYTRRCCYTDTLDGHFWIDNHPEIGGLTIGSGGSGHGFKMGPVIGDMIATTAEGGVHGWSERYRWRELKTGVAQQEEARFKLK